MTTKKTHPETPAETPTNPTADAFRAAATAARTQAETLDAASGNPPDGLSASQRRQHSSDCAWGAGFCREKAKALEETAGLLDGSGLPQVRAWPHAEPPTE